MADSRADEGARLITGSPSKPEPRPSPPFSFYLAIIVVAFTNGIIDLPELAIAFLWKDYFHLTPAQVAAIDGPRFFPWLIKPLYGFISDCFPINGYHRKSYLFIMGMLGFVTWITLGNVPELTVALVIVALLLAQGSTAFMNVIAEALIVEQSRGGEDAGDASKYVSLYFSVRYCGYVVAAYFGGFLLEFIKPQVVFQMTSMFPLGVALASFIYKEKKDLSDGESVVKLRSQVQAVWSAITKRCIWGPAIYILMVRCHPNVESAFFFFFTNELGFRPELLGRLRLVGAFCGMLGIFIYNKWLKNARYRPLLMYTTITASAIGLSRLILVFRWNKRLGIPDAVFAIGDNAIGAVVSELMSMPLLVLAARVCPPGVEGTLYALLMSINNAGGMISSQLGALCMNIFGVTHLNFNNLYILVLIADLSQLLPIFLLQYVPDTDDDAVEAASAAAAPSNTKQKMDLVRDKSIEATEEAVVSGGSINAPPHVAA